MHHARERMNNRARRAASITWVATIRQPDRAEHCKLMDYG